MRNELILFLLSLGILAIGMTWESPLGTVFILIGGFMTGYTMMDLMYKNKKR